MRARQYAWGKCCVCGLIRIRAHLAGNGDKLYCQKHWSELPHAEREGMTIRTYSLNGKDVSKEEFDAATKAR